MMMTLMDWMPFYTPVPKITKQIGTALKFKGFRVAKEFCWDERQENAFAGRGTVDGIVSWLIKNYEIEMGENQYPGFVNLKYRGTLIKPHARRLIQVEAYGLGTMKKYFNKIIVILPNTYTDYGLPKC